MLKRPPQHRVDAEIVYVHPLDPAWDSARLDAECEEMDAAEPGGSKAHPVLIYWSGASRFDLEARHSFKDGTASAAEYLDDAKANKFALRRLGVRKLSSVTHRIRSDDPERLASAQIDAVKWGVLSITGPAMPKLRGEGATELTEADLDELATCTQYGADLLDSIGLAVWRASQPLTDAEKKACAS